MTIELARRLHCRYPGSTAEAVNHWLSLHPDAPVATAPLGSGWMVFAGPGVAWGGAAGLGLHGPVSSDTFAQLDAFFAPRAHEPIILASPYADASLLDGLAEHGFQGRLFRQTLVHRPERYDPEVPVGVVIREGPSGGVIGRGFSEGAEPAPTYQRVERMLDAAPCTRTLVADLDGVPVGGGRVSLSEGFALLYGASVVPEARGKGVHNALLRARLNLAADAGCDTVVIEGTPGSTTERNARRLGFQVAFTQMVFRRVAL